MKRPRQKVTYVYHFRHYQTTVPKRYEPDQEEIDAILDKIYERGYHKLTKAVKQKLRDASHGI